MKANRICLPVLLFSFSQALAAQSAFEINEAEINLMGLEFDSVDSVGVQLGVQLPAHVIAAPDNDTAVVNKFSGVLESWLKRAGEAVNAGDILAIIRSRELITVQQDYFEHFSEAALAQQQFDRDQMLWQQGIIAKSRYEQTEQRLTGAQAQLRASENLLAIAGLRGQEIAALRTDRAELGQVFLRATVDGTLARRHFAVGDSVAADTAIARLTQSGNAWVAIQVPARLLGLFSSNTQLSTPEGDWSLTPRSRDYVINPATQSAEVLAQFTDDAPLLLGQMLNVVVHPSPSSLMIPSQAVVREQGQTSVYIYDAGVIQVRPLQLVPVGDGYVTQSGISAGEQLVIKGAALVKGMQIGLGQ